MHGETDSVAVNAAVTPDVMNWHAIAAAIAAISVVGTAIGLGMPLLSVALEARGHSATMIGLNTAAAGVASIIAAPAATPLATRFGVVRTMLFMNATAAASFAGFYLLDDFWAWFVLRSTLHFALTVLFILSEFWIITAAPSRRRGLILGVYSTVLSLGFAFGPWIFSQLGSEGFAPFGAAIALVTIAAVPVAAARHQSPVLVAQQTDARFGRFIFLVPTATAAVLLFGAVETGGFALFPVQGVRVGHSEGDAALLLTMIGLGNVFLQIPIGFLADRVSDRRRLLVGCTAIGLVGALMMPVLMANWTAMACLLFVWGGAVAGLYTVGLAHLGATLSGRDLASANAAFVFCYGVGMLVGPQIIGIGMDLSASHGFSATIALFFLSYLALAGWRIWVKPHRT